MSMMKFLAALGGSSSFGPEGGIVVARLAIPRGLLSTSFGGEER